MRLRILAALVFLCAFNARAQTVHQIDSITPDHVIAGSGNTLITLRGINLNSPDFPSVLFNAISISGTKVNSQTVTVTIPAADIQQIISYAVHINSTPVTNTVRFRVLSPLASLQEYAPTQFPTAVDTPVVAYGRDFPSNATILFDFQPITTTFVSPAELTGTVPGSLISSSPNNTHHILVYNGPFTAASIGTLQSASIITSDQPTISLSNIPLGTSLTGTGTVRALQGTVTLATPYYTITGPNSADFSNTGGSCANAKVLAAGTSCPIQITATPAALPSPPPSWVPNNSYTLNFEIVDDANGDPNGVPHLQKVTTAGTSGAADPITGGPTFSWNESGGTTAEGPDTLVWTDQGQYVLNVSESATLTVNSNAANNPQTIPLSLTKTIPSTGFANLLIGSNAVNPAGYDFGTVVQFTPTSRTFTLQNAGGAWMTLASPFYALTGANAADFAVSGVSCSNGLFLNGGSGFLPSPGQSCTFTGTFTPSTTAAETATLTINWSSIGGTSGSAAYVLTGTGKTAGTKIALAWTASTSSSLTGYKVYRGTQSGGPYTLLTSLGIVTSYNDTTPVHGNTYCYVVTAIGTLPPYSITESGNSNENCATF